MNAVGTCTWGNSPQVVAASALDLPQGLCQHIGDQVRCKQGTFQGI